MYDSWAFISFGKPKRKSKSDLEMKYMKILPVKKFPPLSPFKKTQQGNPNHWIIGHKETLIFPANRPENSQVPRA